MRPVDHATLRIPGKFALVLHDVAFVQRLRNRDLFKLPGVTETLDWAQALAALDRNALDAETVDATLGVLLKYQDDIARIRGAEAEAILRETVREPAAP